MNITNPPKNCRHSMWSNFLLYSCLGCFSYLFLVRYTDIPTRAQYKLITTEAFLIVVFLFNCVGLSLQWINKWLRNTYLPFTRNYKKIFLAFIGTALYLFILNYLLLVVAKTIIGTPHPFLLARNGIFILFSVWLIELTIVSLSTTISFYKNAIELHKKTEDLKASAIKAQYMALQKQMNPHFLFNSLNTLIAEIEYDPPTAIKFTRDLADVYRYILYSQDKRTASLKSEIDFAQSYVSLQKVRLGNCMEIENHIEENIWPDILLPPLTLQLLVENVFKHNIVNQSNPMTLFIGYRHDDEDNFLIVSNEWRPKQGNQTNGKGLENLSKRCMLLCGKPISIIKENGHFTVEVPFLFE